METTADLTKALEGKSLLIFDFDGTVADTTALHAAAFAQVLAPLSIMSNYSSIAGIKTQDAMRQCLHEAGRVATEIEIATLVSAKQECVRRLIAQGLQPLPGIDAFLRWARPRYRLSMATSGSRVTVQLGLVALGYDGWFNPVVCAEDVQNAKPDPACFLHVLALTGVEASEALIFEDSPVGVISAKSAGVDYIDVSIRSKFFEPSD